MSERRCELHGGDNPGVTSEECPTCDRLGLPEMFETCWDRDYRCCDLTPPTGSAPLMTQAEYNEWYDRHVRAFYENNVS